MKTLIRTKDIARIRHNAGTTIDRLRIDFTDGKSTEWAVDHYEESMSQRSKCKQLKKAYEEIAKACKDDKTFVEFEID